VKVTFSVSAPATVEVVFERRACKGRRCAFVVRTRMSLPVRAGRGTLIIGPTVRGTRLERGAYRAVLRLGLQRATVPFTVK